MARRGEIDQVLISVRNLPPARLHEIMERLNSVCVDISLIPDQAIDLAPDYRVRLIGTLPVLTGSGFTVAEEDGPEPMLRYARARSQRSCCSTHSPVATEKQTDTSFDLDPAWIQASGSMVRTSSRWDLRKSSYARRRR